MSDCCEITPVLALKLPVDSILLRSLPSGRLSWDKAHAAATLVGAESTSDSSVRFTCCTSTGADLAILSWWKGMEMTTFCRDISAFHSLELHSSKYIYIYICICFPLFPLKIGAPMLSRFVAFCGSDPRIHPSSKGPPPYVKTPYLTMILFPFTTFIVSYNIEIYSIAFHGNCVGQRKRPTSHHLYLHQPKKPLRQNAINNYILYSSMSALSRQDLRDIKTKAIRARCQKVRSPNSQASQKTLPGGQKRKKRTGKQKTTT